MAGRRLTQRQRERIGRLQERRRGLADPGMESSMAPDLVRCKPGWSSPITAGP
ncbi:MAG: hypothetical protein U1F59_09070 [Candidatus Competibacteraceae bacterium]